MTQTLAKSETTTLTAADGFTLGCYIARPAGNIACVLQIDVSREGVSPLESTIRQMADSLGASRG